MRWLAHPIGQAFLGLIFLAFVVCGCLFIHYYNVYAAVIDARLAAPIFSQTSLLYAAPRTVATGEEITPILLTRWLRQAGYTEDKPSPVGSFTLVGNTVGIRPGPDAYRAPTPVDVQFDPTDSASVTSIIDTSDHSSLTSYDLEPELVTSLFDEHREKRRLVHYRDLPPNLINAVLDIEDRDFFHHGAVNWWRVPSAVFRDVRSGRREQGASTITMQVARNIFGLGFQRTWRRKLTEVLVAMELEERLTKPQIFELYANQLYLGQRGSYSVHGFGEAADAYFGEDLRNLTLAQCALLAGIIHGPNLDSPYRHPERARRRRDEVLQAMVRAGSITPEQRASAAGAPLVLTAANDEGSDAPYFVDMVRDRISDQIPEHDLSTQSFRIYTTLDPDLQAAAARAVTEGMKGVDAELADLRAHQSAHSRRGARTGAVKPLPPAQVALIALDPHTGAVLALVGGRNYATSQLNHALAQRPTGSIFKPFVYATALETGLLPNIPAITETSLVDDVRTSFPDGNHKPYTPENFEKKYYGEVSLRVALEHSLNNGTIALAEQVGLQAVCDLAHSAGITSAQPTPSVAIGTYRASALEMAGAYTVFANGGVRLTPRMVDQVQSSSGDVVFKPRYPPQPVLDPRVAFLTTNLMQSVLNAGTAIRVRSEGYDAPAAGKTGSSHDAWFAGYTNNLLCIVWVGLDDYTNLNIEGAHAALPIWTEFMKSALAFPAYHDVKDFAPPAGVVPVKIDTVSMQQATPLCPLAQVEVDYYLDGTQPRQTCRLHPSPLTPRGIIASTLNLFHLSSPSPPPPPPQAAAPTSVAAAPAPTTTPIPAQPAAPPQEKPKRGFFGKILHAIGGGGNSGGG
ncbi:MAG TPA: transglycosylase domain-containing protein [Terriglobales bacterium]|nr:transglycosylase domain-containing protein [Terriglobales bacterium]